ncbi:MAG: hypothetical protein IT335_07220 [Thermomicrobiales bacterium]|jgi:hypothetical protein|nr:hypothetical protein [Thermomicrobiales bacterium]
MSEDSNDTPPWAGLPESWLEIELSAEEIHCLVAMLDIQELFGIRFPERAWVGMAPTSIDAGFTSLSDRGLVVQNDPDGPQSNGSAGELSDDDPDVANDGEDEDDVPFLVSGHLVRMLSVIENAEAVVVCQRESRGEAIDVFTFHLSGSLAVSVCDSLDDLYILRAISGAADVEQSIVAICHEQGYQSNGTPSVRLTEEEFSALVTIRNGSIAESGSQGNDDPRSVVAADLSGPTTGSIIVGMRPMGDEIRSRSVTTITGRHGLWRVDDDEDGVTVSTYSSSEFLEEIAAIVATAANPDALVH